MRTDQTVFGSSKYTNSVAKIHHALIDSICAITDLHNAVRKGPVITYFHG